MFFGVVVAIGLALIGVPNAFLWGILAALLRFVPYVWAFLAAAFPVALAFAVDPGWSMVLWTFALFIVLEPLVGQVLADPKIRGRLADLELHSSRDRKQTLPSILQVKLRSGARLSAANRKAE